MSPDDLASELEEATPARVRKILDTAADFGWFENPTVSLVARLSRDDAHPFFARWNLSVNEDGKRSWRFAGARAANGQPLNYNDISLYLEDPSVVEPDDSGCEFRGCRNKEPGWWPDGGFYCTHHAKTMGYTE